MNKTLSTSVKEEQHAIIKKIAELSNMSISQLMKESIKVFIALYHVSNMLKKTKAQELTQEVIERHTRIMAHAEEMVKLMQPDFAQALDSLPNDVLKALEEQRREFSLTMKSYDKPAKRGRPPALITKKSRVK